MSQRADRWSDDEINFLRTCYGPNGGGLRAAVAGLPNRTQGAISFKVTALKLSNDQTTSAKTRKLVWTASEDDRLRNAWEQGGLGFAAREFPDRSQSSVYRRCCEIGLNTDRRAYKPRSTSVRKQSPVVVKIVIRQGECARGDFEVIRRRIPFVVDQIAKEIRRTPAAVQRALISLAARKFEPDALQKLSINREEAAEHALGSHVGATYLMRSNPRKPPMKRVSVKSA